MVDAVLKSRVSVMAKGTDMALLQALHKDICIGKIRL